MTDRRDMPQADDSAFHTAWCAAHFATMREGGAWAVPRTGLIFQRTGQALVLVARMPHDPKMPISAAELDQMQQDDVDLITAKFKTAGIEVRDRTRMQ